MELQEARDEAKRLFADMRPASNRALVEVGRREGEGLSFFAQLEAMTPEGFPIPGLLHYGLTQLLEEKTYGPFEKMRWGFCFDFRDGTFGFELRKFGLRALCEPKNLDAPLLREVLGRARALTSIAERYLSSGTVQQQINAGNVTVENLYRILRKRYEFFRQRAGIAYEQEVPEPVTNGAMITHLFRNPEEEGGALGTAAVDAFFSLTEHLFCIGQAFSPATGASLPLLEFLGTNWCEKAKQVLDLTDPKVKALYDRLLQIREHWRNPIAHGGFMSKGASLYVHVPGIGAMPARLRRSGDGVRVGFHLSNESFSEIVKAFDEFDEQLKVGTTRFGLKWAESGLDVAFDTRSLAEYQAAMISDKQFDRFLEHASDEADRHANMDY